MTSTEVYSRLIAPVGIPQVSVQDRPIFRFEAFLVEGQGVVSMLLEPLLNISVVHTHETTVLRVSGEVDMATAPQLREAALDALRTAPGLLVLDLAGVSFMDSTGIFVLLASQRRAEALGFRFALCRVPRRVQRVLELSRIAAEFEYREIDQDEACGKSEPPVQATIH